MRLVVVRDLFDGAAVAGVQVRWRAEGAPQGEDSVLESGDDGALPPPATTAGTVQEIDRPWRVSQSALETLAVDGDLWTYQSMDVRVVVEFEGEPPTEGELRTLTVYARLSRYLRAGMRLDDHDEKPTGHLAHVRRALPKFGGRFAKGERLDSQGEAQQWRLETPRVPGCYLVVRAKGWWPHMLTAAEVEAQGRIVHARLTRVPWVSGVLLDENGQSISGAMVRVDVENQVDPDQVDLGLTTALPHAVGLQSTRSGRPLVQIGQWVKTDKQGRWRVPIAALGPAQVYVSHAGYSSVLRPIGELADPVEGVEIRLARARAVPVKLHLDGKSLPGAQVRVSWLDAVVGQPTERMQLPDSSIADFSALQFGQRYMLIVLTEDGVRTHGLFTWRGQSELDLSEDLGRYEGR